jgi:hypothetical protein
MNPVNIAILHLKLKRRHNLIQAIILLTIYSEKN